MVTLTGKLGEKFKIEMFGISNEQTTVVDRESIFVAEINGDHVQHKRSFNPKKGEILDERPEIGKSYPALMQYSGDHINVLLNAAVTSTFHDDGFENARIVYARSSTIEMTAIRRAAKTTPGFTFPDISIAN